MDTKLIWKIVTMIELIAATVVVLFDLFLPSLVILAMVIVSLLIRREGPASLGFQRPESWSVLAIFSFLTAFLLQLFDVGVIMPIMNRVTGTTIQSSPDNLKGNPSQLILLIVLSWTLAAFCEEIAFRGYLPKLLTQLFGSGVLGLVLSVGISSILFGLLHLEQGIIGVVVATFDGLVFSWLKRKFNSNLWATILAHGFYNTVGVLVFYFTGPIYGLW